MTRFGKVAKVDPFSDIRCQTICYRRRPDRGPEHECGRIVRFYVPGWSNWVCGIHARAYTPRALRPIRYVPGLTYRPHPDRIGRSR